MKYFCCDQKRRDLLLHDEKLNGLDYLEVTDQTGTLSVHFVNPITGTEPGTSNFRIKGGVRIRNIAVIDVKAGKDPNELDLSVSSVGDFSRYMLQLVKDPDSDEPPPGFDPQFATLEFSFRPECRSQFDCKPRHECPPEQRDEPEINYLAKDYQSFRQLLLDRMSQLVPGWKETSPADLGIAIVELLAYKADQLSYEQDAVTTEAYLGTSRSRLSVRRHALLMDYTVLDGCNSRTWVQVRLSNKTNDGTGLSSDQGSKVQFLTRAPNQTVEIKPNFKPYSIAMLTGPTVFEPLENPPLFYAHNQILFYTWGNERCCLPRGATSATLDGLLPDLKATDRKNRVSGTVLIMEEVRGPKTGLAEDADPSHRHAVRLTKVAADTDPLNGDHPVVKVEWAAEDALPFPLCISSVTDDAHGRIPVPNVSIASGNIILADHGRTIRTEHLYPDTVPPDITINTASNADPCDMKPGQTRPARYRPILEDKPLTMAASYDPYASAAAAMKWNPQSVNPQLWLTGSLKGATTDWVARQSLLNSLPDSNEFVAEIENDGYVHIRFGELAKRPEADTKFTTTCRIGNGTAGNIGRDTLFHIVTSNTNIDSVRNPTPAHGGIEPESIEEVRVNAPQAYLTQERAVTPSDYENVVERNPEVKRAAATYEWTGSWYTVFLTVDRHNGQPVDDPFRATVESEVEKYRMAGYDLETDAPAYVALDVEITICVDHSYLRDEVESALRTVFSDQVLSDGTRGFFHPENLTFGQTIYFSQLYSVAQQIPGVASVQITKFERQGEPSGKYLQDQMIQFERLEIPRLDNDPNFPENGVLTFKVGGGK